MEELDLRIRVEGITGEQAKNLSKLFGGTLSATNDEWTWKFVSSGLSFAEFERLTRRISQALPDPPPS